MNDNVHNVAEPAAPPLRILLVEDDEFDVAVFGRAFHRGKIPCEIIRCRSGEEALEGLRDAELEFDLLVTDHQLPGLSGFDLCLDLVKRRPPFALVLLTGVGSEQMAIRALRAGINDYIVKDASQEYLDLLPLVLPRVARRHRQRRHGGVDIESQPPDSSETTWTGGYRLGLSACADLVQQRGGRVWVEDSAGDSPTLHLSVPLARDEVASWTAAGADSSQTSPAGSDAVDRESSVTIQRPADMTSRHVLVVHPNPIVTFVAQRTAERSGGRVAVVQSGGKALEALEREPFDLVLLALNMPEPDGLETARQIRRYHGASRDVRILALGVDEEAADGCREAGIDGIVAAPISVQSLTAAIERLG